ncbi:MAG: prolyl oligopeptidase family serine peptidase [Clostridia bacterium]|nr:prolyl oligopeptidase family serine peptidase [Clostridia bacterium]
MKKTVLLWVMACITVLTLALLASCGGGDVTTVGGTTAKPAETTAEVTTTEAVTVQTAPIAVAGVSDYVIVYDGNNETVKNEVTSYVTKMKSKFGIKLTAKRISDVTEPYAHEIIVGDLGAQRAVVNEVKASCRASGDFAVAVKGDDVVLYATDDTNYSYLFAALVGETQLMPDSDKNLTYSSDRDFYYHKSELKDMNYAEYKGKTAKLTQAFVVDQFDHYETTTATGAKLVYRLYVPSNYDPEKEYPLLVVLHGAGERGTDNERHMIYMLRAMFNQTDSPVYDAIILCPQCPENQQWVDTPWSNGNYRTADVPESDELATVMRIVSELRETYTVDSSRIYAMGISMGGFGTWDLLARHGDVFAAGIPICGGGDQTKAKELAKIPIYTFHGSADGVVPPSGTKMMAMMIQKSNPTNFHYEEFEGAGHDIWETVAAREDVIRWLFEQSKAN